MDNQAAKTKKNGRRKFSGIVVSDKMQKTITVKVEKVRIVPGINKRIMRSKTYKVHDEKGQFKAGDKVAFTECRPLSKEKRWRVVSR